jgi:hypothetical protein
MDEIAQIVNDDMLLDYIKAMIENGKTKEEMRAELTEFLTEEEVSSIVDLLPKMPSKTAPNRLFSTAMKDIQSGKDKQPDLRSRIQKKDLRGLLGKKSSKIVPKVTVITSDQLAQLGKGSVHVVTKSVKPKPDPKSIPCRFGTLCTNPDCLYLHEMELCKYQPCLNKFCVYFHPDRPSLHGKLKQTLEAAVDSMDTDIPMEKVCKFDPHCLRNGCFYFHPSRMTSVS